VLPGQQLQSAWNGAPIGSRLLARPPFRLKRGDNWGNNSGDNIDSDKLPVLNSPGGNSPGDNSADQCKPTTFYFGVYRPCDEFVTDAVRAGHPIGKQNMLPSALQEELE